MKKKICCIFLIFVLCFSVSANAMWVDSQGAICINADTGEVYFEKNADTLMTPASITKVMTLYILFEKIAAGEITEETLIPVSANAAKLSRSGDATNVPLTAGSYVSVKSLIEAIVAVSACASCTVVAEYFSGSETLFAAYMTQKAQEMGINAYFYDASGLSNDNLISPRGIAALVRTFIATYPGILTYTSKSSITFNRKKYSSTNLLLETADSQYSYPGADGFKTGSTSKAGKCLVSTAVRGNSRIICVVMKASTNHYRYADSHTLLNDAAYKIDYFGNNLFATDIRAFIDDEEIPCVYKQFGASGIMVLTEDLDSYGFDITFDETANALYITEDSNEEIVPVEKPKAPLWEIERSISGHSAKVYLVKDDTMTELTNVVYTDSGFAVGFGELSSCYEKVWVNETRSAYLNK